MKNKINSELANKNKSLLGKAKSASIAALSGLATVISFVYDLDSVEDKESIKDDDFSTIYSMDPNDIADNPNNIWRDY